VTINSVRIRASPRAAGGNGTPTAGPQFATPEPTGARHAFYRRQQSSEQRAMGIIDFLKEKLGGGPDADAIKAHVASLGLRVQSLGLTIDDGVATVTGLAVNRAEASKIVMAIGNSDGITRVDNQMRVPLSSIQPAATPAAAAAPGGDPAGDVDADEEAVVFYPVAKGDTLSGIAKRLYGDPMKYPKIFEANQPMLTDPDKIYPGQVLRVPPLD
jgi:hypothetical protein